MLLTHGHIDHMWSAQKVSDTYGCPTYIHPADRYMLKDPVKALGQGFALGLASLAVGALFREPRQIVELDRDGDKLDLGGITVAVEHTSFGLIARPLRSSVQRSSSTPSKRPIMDPSGPAIRCSSS